METSVNATIPFSIQLIEALKKEGFISSAIMLPLMVGAYKVKDEHATLVDYRYLRRVFSNLMAELCSSDKYLHLRECESSHNFVFEVCDISNKKHNLKVFFNEKIVLYCDDVKSEVSEIRDNDIAVDYLVDKYIAVLGKYCNFSDKDAQPKYPHMRELDMNPYLGPEIKYQKSELDIIKAILNR